MLKTTLAQLGSLLRKTRGDRGIREVALELGLSPATLSRVEGGSTPDLGTFTKICKWLAIDPGDVLGVPPRRGTPPGESGPITVAAHLRVGQTPSPELAKALADMIIAAQRMMESEST